MSIAEKARVDMEYMSALSGKTAEEPETELSDVIFRDIQCAEDAAAIPKAFVDLERFPFVTADEYLSGHVRRKLRIVGYEQDIRLVQEHPRPKEDFVGMEIDGRLITDKEEAGKAILDVCTKMTGSDTVVLGKYRGSSLVLAYNGASNEYRMTMKETLSHAVVLGADVFGNITRMDNALEGFEAKLTSVCAELADTEKQLENAREEMNAPFAKEEELAKKVERLKELNILLNMDQKDRSLLDDEPEEDTPEPPRARAYER